MYEFARKALKTIFVPFFEAIISIMPRSLRVFLFIVGADSLGLKNVRFDTPMKIKDRASKLNLGLFPGDRSVVPSILVNGSWELSEPAFAASCMDPGKKYALFDVGANFGLFTLQLLELLCSSSRGEQLVEATLFEPDPGVLNLLRENIRNANMGGTSIEIVGKALGKAPGRATFYLDNANKANNSLAPKAMSRAVAGITEIEVEVIGADELLSFLPKNPSTRVIYKSDLQGIDPDIVSAIPQTFWDRVDILVIELWPQVLKDYAFDTEAFKVTIASFEKIMIEENGVTRAISADEVGEVVQAAEDHRYFNLLCSRTQVGE